MRLNRRNFGKVVSAALAMPALSRAGFAQGSYPSKPVTVVVPYNAGGPVDLMGRLILDKVEQRLGQRFVLEAKPGAGGAIGAELVSRAPNDGYTLMMGSASALVTLKVARGKELSFDPLADIVPVKTVSRRPYVLFVNPKSGYRTAQDFIDAAKARPGELSYGSTGVGGSDYFVSEYFKSAAGLDILHIPYNGGTAAVQAVEVGEIDMYLGGLTQYVQYGRSGRLSALGVTSLERISQAPELPVLADIVPGFQSYASIDFFAPKGISAEVLELLDAELTLAMQQPGVKEKVLESGELTDDGSAEITAFMKADYEALDALARKLGLALE